MKSGTKLTIFAVVSLTLVASASVFGFYRSNNARSGGINTVDVASEDALSGKAPVAEHYASRGEAFEMRFDDALLVCDKGSLRRGTRLSISGIDSDLPPLGAGMVNVTSEHSGYRFLPHGEHFRTAASVRIGYDSTKLPKGYSRKDIYTYYYDESLKVWKRLQRDSVGESTVYSRTTHFTDMINAVVSHPEMPEGQSFTPTGLKELKAADPATGVTLAEVSAGNSQGELSASYTLELPQGRRGMQPNLTMGYSSGGGDGLLGVGWDMRTSAISVDSRWGAPRYDSGYETESYVLDGDELLPSPRYRSQWEQRNTGGAKTFWRRTESSYDKIERHGNSPSNYYWIVTDKGGTKYYYGTYAGYKAADAVLPKDASGNTNMWPLCRVEDADGNYMSYHYTKRSHNDPAGIYLGEQLWLESIEYTGNSRTDEKGQYYVFFGSDSNRCQRMGNEGTDLSGSGDGGSRGASGRSRSSRSVAVSADLCDPLSPPGSNTDLLVEVVKYDKRSGNLIPGAVFELSDLRGVHGVWPATTDANGEASWDVCIQQGDTIVIREISAPGYCNMVDKIIVRMPSGSTTPQVLSTSDPGMIKSIQATNNHIIIELYNEECDECLCDNAVLEIHKVDANTSQPLSGVNFVISYGSTTIPVSTDNNGFVSVQLTGLHCNEEVTVNEKQYNGYCDSLTGFKFRMSKTNPYDPCIAEILTNGQIPSVIEKTNIESNKLILHLKDSPCVQCHCGPLEINIEKFNRSGDVLMPGIPFAITLPDTVYRLQTSTSGNIHLEIPRVACGAEVKIDELPSASVCNIFGGYRFVVEKTASDNSCEVNVLDHGIMNMIKTESVTGLSVSLQIYNDICVPPSVNADSIEGIYITGPNIPGFYTGMDFCDCDREYPKHNRNEARSGHLQSQRDKLRRVLVYYGDEMVRSYSFCYGEDIHGMPQLRKIRQWGRDYTDGSFDHDIEYYSEVVADSLLGTATSTLTTATYGLGGLLNGVAGKLGKPIERSLSGVMGTRTVIGGNASITVGGDAGVYAGIGANTSSKLNSASYDLGASYGAGYGLSTLCDVDGDGLMDRLLVSGKKLYYQRQHNGQFLSPVRIASASNYLKDRRVTINHGPTLNVMGVSGGVNWSTTTSTTGTYLSDFDGDGLPDIVSDSRIRRMGARYGAPRLNIPDGCGLPTVVPDTTPHYPCIDPMGLDAIPSADASIERDLPHYDMVRVWENEDLPGRVITSIDAKAWLGGLVAGASDIPDTVVLSVEYHGITHRPSNTNPIQVLVASDTLAVGDTLWRGNLLDPANGYLSREYIDRILSQCEGEESPAFGEGTLFFRARSIGGRDVSREIHWNPLVTVDQAYRYPTHGQRSEVAGFAMGGGSFTAPGSGQAVLRVPTAAADFASAVRLKIRYNNTYIRTLTPGGNAAWDTVLNLAADDSLFFYAEGDTSTIWKNNQWHPYLYYKTLTVGNESYTTLYFDTLAGGVVDTIRMLEYHIVPNYRCYRAGIPQYYASAATTPYGHGFGGWHAVQYRHDDSVKLSLYKLNSLSNMPSNTNDLQSYYGNLTDSNYMMQISDTTTSGAVGGVLSLFGCMPLAGNDANRRMEGIYPNAYVSGPNISLGVMTDTLLPKAVADTIPCDRPAGDRKAGLAGRGPNRSATTGGKLDKVSKSKNFSYTVALYSAGNGSTWMEHDLADLNGDGRPDVIHGGEVYYTKPYQTIDYEDAARHPFGGSHPYKGTGNSRSVVRPGEFVATCTKTSSSGRGSEFVRSLGAGKASDSTYRTLADLNGDGLPDIVCSDGTVRLGTGYGFLTQQQWAGLATVSGSLSLSASGSAGSFSLWNNAISGGVGVTTARNTQPVFLQDMDGDGLPDLVERDFLNGRINYRRNTGSGFATTPTAWRNASVLNNLDEYGTSTSASINIQGTGGWTFWGIKAGGSAGANAALSLSNEKLQISDFDGDGVADLLKSESGTEIAVRYSRMGRTGLLKSIANPLGGTIYADYELTAPTVYHQRRWVVRELKICDGLPGDGRDTLRTTYSYSHGYYDRDEKAFLGFAKVTETRWNGDTVHSTTDKFFSNSDIHTKGIPVASFLRDSRGRLFMQTANTLQQETLDVIGDAERVFPHITRSQTCYYEGQPTAGIVQWQESDYDFGNGNVVQQRHGSTDQPTVVVEISYHAQYRGNYIVNKVQRVEIQGMRLRTTNIDTLGHYTAIMDYDGQNTLATRYVFDVYGNITDVRGPNTAVHYTYEGDVHTYPESVTDTFGTSSQMQNYDMRYGVPLTVTDRAGNQMEYTLDSWGRPLTIRGPKEIADGAPYTIRYSYRKAAAGKPASATTENYDPQHGNNTIRTYTYCDGLGRVVQTRHEAEVGGVEKLVVSGHTVFDGLGRAVATYHPTEAHRDSTRFAFAVDAVAPATATYDVLNRPLVQTAPDGSTTRYAYGFCGSHLNKMLFRTAVTDPNGHTSTTLKDADGRQWATKVAGQPWLYCDYSPVGDLLAVYSSNNGDWSRAYEYDWLGRRTSYNEDNLATYYTYDGLNPATETYKWQENGHPKQKKITCRYIAHRLDSVIYSDSTLPTVYSYDYAGRVASVLDESGRMDYSYGSMGEVKSETRTYALPFLATDLALTTQYEYDSWGRTTSITYPDGETVSYDYDRGGQLKKVWSLQFGVYSYLDSVLYDKFGAVTSRKYGNGLKMQYAYHPQNRRLTAITTLSGNSQLSHTAYTYDPAGNITQAVSSYPWLPGQTFTENFAYDSTNQLVSAANAQTYALSVTYGDWGKIQQYGLQQADLASNTTTSQTRYYSYGSLNEGQTTFAPNNINYADGTNVNEQYGINGSLQRRETNIPGNQPEIEHYRFTANGNLQAYMYENLLYVHYGYNAANTRTYKYSFDLNPNWVNGRLEAVNFSMHNAMFYPNSYLNFNNDGHYTKHYYNGMERIASRLGDQNISINVNDPELQDRKDQLDSNIRRNIVYITGYEFLPVGEEQNPEDPKPLFELPVIGLNNLQPSADGIYYYHPNHLGSTCYVTDENAVVQQGFLYAPFGEITNEYNSGWQNGNIPKYAFNAKELDEETGMYYYEARYYAPPVFVSRDPLFEKYPTFSPYTYCANNPIKYIDPDGRDVYLLFYANSDKMFEAAAETRKREIETSRGFNRKKDIVIMNEFSDIGDIESLTNDAVNRYSLMYGETVEVGIWSHASWDGPRGEVETTGDYASGRQLTLEGWNNINFNWNRNNANILFYGCNTGNEIRKEKWDGSFARKISKQRNFKDVNVWGQQTSAFPSFYPNIRAINLARNYNFGYWVDCNIYMVGGDKNQVAKSLWFTPGDYPKAKPMNVYKNGQLIRTAFQNR